MVKLKQAEQWEQQFSYQLGINSPRIDGKTYSAQVQFTAKSASNVRSNVLVADYLFQGNPFIDRFYGGEGSHVGNYNDVVHLKVDGAVDNCPDLSYDLGYMNFLTGNTRTFVIDPDSPVEWSWVGETEYNQSGRYVKKPYLLMLISGTTYIHDANTFYGYYIVANMTQYWSSKKGDYWNYYASAIVVDAIRSSQGSFSVKTEQWSIPMPVMTSLDECRSWVLAQARDIVDAQYSHTRLARKGSTRYSTKILSGIPGNPSPMRLGFEDIEKYFPSKDRKYYPWSNLAAQAYSKAQFFTGNGIQYASDFLQMKSQLASLKTSFQSIAFRRSFKGKSKALASLYLAVHYGIRLTAADTKDLIKQLNRASSLYGVFNASASESWARNDVQYVMRYQYVYKPFARLKSIYEQLITLCDLEATFGNAWDSIPYSFVVDWFTNLGSVFEKLDNFYNVQQVFETVACGKTITARTDVSLSVFGRTFVFPAELYIRSYSKEPVSPSFFSDVTINPKPLSHFIEGGALVIQRIGKH